MELNEKMLEKAKNAKTAEELVAIARENSIELTEEEAKSYFAKLNAKEGELSDDELDNVSGGGKCGTIYKDKRPVVTDFNHCAYFENEDPNGHQRFCMHCKYLKREGLFLCYCPQRYDN